MKKNLKKVLGILLTAIMTMSLIGCGQKKIDATGYVKAEMDLVTQHDVDQYVKEMGVTKDKAEEIYQESIDNLNISEQIFGDDDMPETLEEGYEKWFLDALSKTKYTVMEAEEKDGNYVVKVEVEPFKVFEGVMEELTTQSTAYMADLTTKAMNGEEVPSTEQINIDIFNMMLKILNEVLENPTYSEKVVVETKIIKNSDGEYEIDEESFGKLGEKLFDVSGIEAAE